MSRKGVKKCSLKGVVSLCLVREPVQTFPPQRHFSGVYLFRCVLWHRHSISSPPLLPPAHFGPWQACLARRVSPAGDTSQASVALFGRAVFLAVLTQPVTALAPVLRGTPRPGRVPLRGVCPVRSIILGQSVFKITQVLPRINPLQRGGCEQAAKGTGHNQGRSCAFLRHRDSVKPAQKRKASLWRDCFMLCKLRFGSGRGFLSLSVFFPFFFLFFFFFWRGVSIPFHILADCRQRSCCDLATKELLMISCEYKSKSRRTKRGSGPATETVSLSLPWEDEWRRCDTSAVRIKLLFGVISGKILPR